MIQFFGVIPQSLNLRLFATHKLFKRPFPSKRHGEISYFFSVKRDPNDEIDHKTKQNKNKTIKKHKENKQKTNKQNKQTKQNKKQNKNNK